MPAGPKHPRPKTSDSAKRTKNAPGGASGKSRRRRLASLAGKKAAEENEACPDAAFPVVAIGASAGGLEAYKELFRALPADTGMAFVLLQHLDPSHKSMLAEII